MIVKTFDFPVMDGRYYLIYQEDGSDAVLIDCGKKINKIKAYCAEHGLTVKYVLLTHGHFDHVADGSEWQKEGAKVYIHAADEDKLYTNGNLGIRFGMMFPGSYFHADYILRGGESLELCGMRFDVIHTPGHTPGSVCYLTNGALFSGDTLFAGGYGRTDFPGGSYSDICASAKKLFTISNRKSITVYPGHGAITNLDYEAKTNPINNI